MSRGSTKKEALRFFFFVQTRNNSANKHELQFVYINGLNLYTIYKVALVIFIL